MGAWRSETGNLEIGNRTRWTGDGESVASRADLGY